VCREDLMVLRRAIVAHNAGVVRDLTPNEVAAVTAYKCAFELECRNAGYNSSGLRKLLAGHDYSNRMKPRSSVRRRARRA
jgi:hypothetical protein